MKELLKVYEEDDDRANIKKYSEKIKMIEEGIEADRKKNLKAIEKRTEDFRERSQRPSSLSISILRRNPANQMLRKRLRKSRKGSLLSNDWERNRALSTTQKYIKTDAKNTLF